MRRAFSFLYWFIWGEGGIRIFYSSLDNRACVYLWSGIMSLKLPRQVSHKDIGSILIWWNHSNDTPTLSHMNERSLVNWEGFNFYSLFSHILFLCVNLISLLSLLYRLSKEKRDMEKQANIEDGLVEPSCEEPLCNPTTLIRNALHIVRS